MGRITESERNKIKAKFLKELEKNYGNITKSLKSAKLSRPTLTKYRQEDQEFREAIENIRTGFLDEIESNWYKDAIEGKLDTVGRIFFAKSQMRDRGFNETKQIEIEDKRMPIKILPAFDATKIEPTPYTEIEQNTEENENN